MILIILFVLVAGIAIGAGSVYLLGQRTPKVIQQACNHPELAINGFAWENDFENNVQRAVLTCVCQNCGDLFKETTSVIRKSKDKGALADERYHPALKAKGWLYSEESKTWLR